MKIKNSVRESASTPGLLDETSKKAIEISEYKNIPSTKTVL
jgi:hypothetical protein